MSEVRYWETNCGIKIPSRKFTRVSQDLWGCEEHRTAQREEWNWNAGGKGIHLSSGAGMALQAPTVEQGAEPGRRGEGAGMGGDKGWCGLVSLIRNLVLCPV